MKPNERNTQISTPGNSQIYILKMQTKTRLTEFLCHPISYIDQQNFPFRCNKRSDSLA